MQDKNFSLLKKMFFSFITICIFFILIELGARCYYYIKCRNSHPFLYGGKFLVNLIKDRESFRIYNSYDHFSEFNQRVDKLFEERNNRNFPLAVREPTKNLSWGNFVYKNKFGFRNKDIELTKKAGITRIIFLGGSFVEGVGVEDSQTFESLLEEEVKKISDKYEVINAGAGGANINRLLENLIEQITKFDPDYLVLFSAYNNHSLVRNNLKLSFQWKISNFFYNTSVFYSMLREKISLKIYKDNNYYLYNYQVSVKKADVDSLMGLYRNRLAQIYTVCKEKNIRLILGLQPEFIPVGLRHLQDLLDKGQIRRVEEKLQQKNSLSHYELEYYLQGRFNLEMKDFAEQNGILLFDAVSIFPKDKYPYFIDQIHPNQKGTSLIAKSLYSFLLKNNILKIDKNQ